MAAPSSQTFRWSNDETSHTPLTEAGQIRSRIAAGVLDESSLTDGVFFARHPQRNRRPIATRERHLAAEWLSIRDGLVRPALAATPTPAPTAGPAVPLGALTCQIPGRKPFQYRFTADDLVTTARFLVGEAGGRDNAENRGTLWAMLNRYAFFRDQVPGWGSFGGFLAQYSQTLQPYLRYWASAKDFVAKCNSTFDNPGCPFQPTRSQTYPGTQVPMGQLKSFLALQATPWARLPEAARRLALQTLTGQIPNPIGNATEVADTKVYFQRANGTVDSRTIRRP
jgi:hypothetical protein